MRVGREDNHAKSASARVLRGRSAGSPRGEARTRCAPRESNAVVTEFRSRSRRPGAVSVKKSLGQQHRVSVSHVCREDNHAKSTSVPVLRGPSAGSRGGEARTRRAPRGSHAVATMSRSHSRRLGTMSIKKSLGQRRGMEHAARWPRRQPRQVRQRTRSMWFVSRFSTGRSARRSRSTGAERGVVTCRSRSRGLALCR